MIGDELLPATCQAIVAEATKAIEQELVGRTMTMRLPGGPVVGRQITIDAAEKGAPLNMCRVAVLDPNLAPEGEVVRLEYEHDKPSKFGVQRIYSIQSVRRRGEELVLLENFLANGPIEVREEDFRPIKSETYGRATVLNTLHDWVMYRAWQLQEMRKQQK
ncbi:MAG: hypothetical protein JWN01_1050 [Patescibacteria group bacterium]|nr:hypothetical protein [Patescibacteria group bacterium]